MDVQTASEARRGRIKCIVWDLDETLWRGTLLEDGAVALAPETEAVVRALDERGILQSIASKNDHDVALAKLRELGILDYFLYPQVNWGSKSSSVANIAQKLNIGIDTLAFIDDQPFERDEVAHACPSVLTLDSARLGELLGMEEFMPRVVTDETRNRRLMYASDIERHRAEESFEGPADAFLASLDMEFAISRADPDDLDRIEELVARTNQLNTTGRIYSLDELAFFSRSNDHELWVSSLSDRYGTYGKIGVALLERGGDVLTIKAFLMSCRVMARGVGSVFLSWIVNRARGSGLRLRAEWRPTERNRMMLVTYRFSGFVPVTRDGGFELLEHDGGEADYPAYVAVLLGGAAAAAFAGPRAKPLPAGARQVA